MQIRLSMAELGNKSYQLILNASQELFWKHGISRVTVEEICSAAGLSKMTFYRYFKNKNELAEKVLQQFIEANTLKYSAIMEQEIPFAEKVKLLVLMKHQSTNNISDELIRDIYRKDESGLQKLFEESGDRMMARLMEDFGEAQKKGWIRSDLNLNFMFYFLNHLSTLMVDKNFLSLFSNSHDAIMELTNLFFYGIMPANTESKTTQAGKI